MAVLVMVVASGVAGCTPPPGTCPDSESGLRLLAAARDLQVGTAYRAEFATGDACYEPTATREFNSLTPEIATFSNRIAAVEGRYDFAEADEICGLAQRNDMDCQAHALIWDPVDHPEWGIVPNWIKTQPPDQRRATMISYVTAVATHFRGTVDAYTLVNEAFDSAGHITANTWSTTGDDSYIFDAFRAARQADPGAKLVLQRLRRRGRQPQVRCHLRSGPAAPGRDHRGRGRGRHPTAAADRRGRAADARRQWSRPGPDPASVAANIARLGSAGLLVRITEMDVRIPVDADGSATDADLQRQRQMYEELVRTCIDASNCDGVTFWGFTDAHSWITENPGTFPGQGAAHPFDALYQPKPAYQGIRDALT